MSEKIFFAKSAPYTDPGFARQVAELLDTAGFKPSPGTRILLKPNLVSPFRSALACTHKDLVRAVCAYLLELGTKPRLGDSPAFGTASGVAANVGITKALAGMDVKIIDLKLGGKIRVSDEALDSELILNLPKLKAHGQMYVTAAVKNLFGCVSGFRKALAHQTHGERANRLESMIIDVMLALPRLYTLLDAVMAMHVSGPTGGEPLQLSLLAAAENPVALDTAIYVCLGFSPDDVPLWREARLRGLAGAWPQELEYPLARPEDFAGGAFVAPAKRTAVAFRPWRFVRGRLRSLCAKFQARQNGV